MSSITTPFYEREIQMGAPYRLGYSDDQLHSHRIYPQFSTLYMQNSELFIIFTHSYYLKIRKGVVTTEIGRSLFATVHGLRYIEWTLHIYKLQRNFSLKLVRQTNCDIKGEFRVQFSAQSKTGKKIQSWAAQWRELKHRVEFVPQYNDELAKIYESDEFNLGQIKIEVKLAFSVDDFDFILPAIDINPPLKLAPKNAEDDRLQALKFVAKINLVYYITCTDKVLTYDRMYLYISCRYLHDYMDSYPEETSIVVPFCSNIVGQVLSFAFCGMCEVKYSGGSLISDDFNKFQQFIACLNLFKPLMYKELIKMFDDRCCRRFQKCCNTRQPPGEINTLQFLRLAIRWGFPKLEASTIARIVSTFPETYASHLNVEEQPHIVQEMVQSRYDYEMYEFSEYSNVGVTQLSPLERIELLKVKCRQVHKWIGSGLTTSIPSPLLMNANISEVMIPEEFYVNDQSEAFD